MGDLNLNAYTGHYSRDSQHETRKINQGVSLEQVKQATLDNNLDEVVVKDAKGELYITYADELAVNVNSPLPKAGDKVSLPFIDGVAEVVHSDDELNEDIGYMMAGGPIGLLGARIIGCEIYGNASGIEAISQPLEQPGKAQPK